MTDHMADMLPPDNHVPPPHPPPDPGQDPVTAQVSAAWGMLLTQMTAQGATRMEIAAVAAGTARQILGLTAGALWPEFWEDRPLLPEFFSEREYPTYLQAAYADEHLKKCVENATQ